MRERLAGFRQALQEHGVPLLEDWVVTSPLSIKGGREAMRQLLSHPERPTAVFMANNLLSLGGLLAVHELGLRCPEDIALIGFDDHPWAAVARPPLTVIRQPAWQVGQVAGQILLDQINGDPVSDSRVLLECELIARQSC
jgi:LacI family transcriptional regulator